MTSPLSGRLARRTVLKSMAAGAAALAASPWTQRRAAAEDDEPFDPGGRIRVDYDETVSFNELYGFPPMLGRSEAWRLRVVSDPSNYNDIVGQVNYDDVIPIYRALRAEPPPGFDHNPIWYELDEGYIHSSWIVPVKEEYHEPEDVIGDGFWGEITVPTSWQHYQPELRTRRYYDLAYGEVFRVVDRVDEEDGRAWYRIVDDLYAAHRWWIQAKHVRRIEESEFDPISPEVPPEDKRIEISLGNQTLVCLEYGVPVFRTRIASGATFFDPEGKPHHFHTPYGEHYVQRKTPGRHMVGGESISDIFDLPGVPWCTFFTQSGAAIHGTYWHNDYGRPRSHGCVNVTPDAAKWVYQWVNPYAGHDDEYRWTEQEERAHATIINVDTH